MIRTLLTLLIIFSIGAFCKAQKRDTVSIGANYSDQVWYDMANGVRAREPKDNWDIAFDVSNFGSSIRLNSIGGAELWRYPGDTSNFGTLDTSGISNWDKLYNSDTSWAYGAFCRYQSGTDVGWGIYNSSTHIIEGDSLYVIRLPNGTYQKLWIQELASGTYTFRHASLDNSMDRTGTLDKGNFPDKNFAYYNLRTQSALDREPASADWDLLFTQYTAFLPTPYQVSGILQNKDVEVAQVHPVADPMNYDDTGSQTFRSEINTVGYDWKSYGGSGYSIEDSLVYFIQKGSGDIWRMVLKDFGGSSNGDYIFHKENLSTTTGLSEASNRGFVRIYPNPVDRKARIVLDQQGGEAAFLRVRDMNGRTVKSTRIEGSGLSKGSIDVSGLDQGIYVVILRKEDALFRKKMVIDR